MKLRSVWVSDDPTVLLYFVSAQLVSLARDSHLHGEETDLILHTCCEPTFKYRLLDFGNQTIANIPADKTNVHMVSCTTQFL